MTMSHQQMKQLLDSKHIQRVQRVTEKQSPKALRMRTEIQSLILEAGERGISLEKLSKMIMDEGIVLYLMDNGWNQTQAAKQAGVHRNVMSKHLNRWADTVGEWLK